MPAPAIELSPEAGRRGSVVQVNGSGFAAGEPVESELRLQRLAKVAADSEGDISTSVTIPSNWRFSHEFDVRATGEISRRTASEPFTIA